MGNHLCRTWHKDNNDNDIVWPSFEFSALIAVPRTILICWYVENDCRFGKGYLAMLFLNHFHSNCYCNFYMVSYDTRMIRLFITITSLLDAIIPSFRNLYVKIYLFLNIIHWMTNFIRLYFLFSSFYFIASSGGRSYFCDLRNGLSKYNWGIAIL